MDSNTQNLCRTLAERVQSLTEGIKTNETEFESRCTIEKLRAVLEGDFMAFYNVTERELQRKDEQIANEYSSCEYLTNGMRRLRNRNLENEVRIADLMKEIEDLTDQKQVDDAGIAFQIPFTEVKKYLSHLEHFPDSILDPEQTEAMKEYGWRRILQRFIERNGNFPVNPELWGSTGGTR